MILGKCIKTAKDETSSERPVRKLSRWRGWQNYLRSWMRSWLKIPLSLPSSLWRHKEVIKFGEMGIDLQKERHETRLRLKRALTDTYRGRASKQGCEVSRLWAKWWKQHNYTTMTGILNGASKGEHKSQDTHHDIIRWDFIQLLSSNVFSKRSSGISMSGLSLTLFVSQFCTDRRRLKPGIFCNTHSFFEDGTA